MIYEKLLRPILFSLDAEDAHKLGCAMMPFAASLAPPVYTSPRLKTKLLGEELFSPLGLAAGFDKNGRYVEYLGRFGFSFAEIGSVQAKATNGFPRPRIFRLPEDCALINRLGLNGEGVDVVAPRLRNSQFSLPVAVNITKTNDPSIIGDAAVSDVIYTFEALKDLPIMYALINVSCPNTDDGIIQETEEIGAMLAEVQKRNMRKIPILVKVSPDSSDKLLEGIVSHAVKYGVDGYVCGNTTTTRDMLKTPKSEIDRIGVGGLSGPPLKQLAIDLCRRTSGLKSREQVIIGAGGIACGKDVYEFLRAGAVAVQAYTGFVYKGPSFCKQVCMELDAILASENACLSEIVGAVA